MPCSVKDYIEREKRLIDISILAGCHVLLMNPPLPPSGRTRFRETARKSYIYRTGESQHNSTRFSFDEEFNSIVHSFRFSVFIN